MKGDNKIFEIPHLYLSWPLWNELSILCIKMGINRQINQPFYNVSIVFIDLIEWVYLKLDKANYFN